MGFQSANAFLVGKIVPANAFSWLVCIGADLPGCIVIYLGRYDY